MSTYKEIVKKHIDGSSDEQMHELLCLTSKYIEQPTDKEEFLEKVEAIFNPFLTHEEAKMAVDAMINESKEHPKGEMWTKENTLKAFRDFGYETKSEKYSENGVYYAMNMVYSDFYPMYGEEIKKYVQHAYLFLKDKDFSGHYAKEKWYALKK